MGAATLLRKSLCLVLSTQQMKQCLGDFIFKYHQWTNGVFPNEHNLRVLGYVQLNL